MLQLIKRCPEYGEGYKAYCRELYDHNVVFFRPSNPECLKGDWFERSRDWYERKEKGLVEGQIVSFHYWAVDDGRVIGEFQLRTGFPPKVMQDIGSVGYAVRVSEWNRGYGTQILRRGLAIAKEHGMEKVLLNINAQNTASIHICEKLGGELRDIIERYNEPEGRHLVRRYWIML